MANDRGSVTAELAVTLPVVVLILGWCLAAMSLLGTRVLVIDQAAQAARMIGRGAQITWNADAPSVRVLGIDRTDGIVCVTLQHTAGIIPVTARACALDGGQ